MSCRVKRLGHIFFGDPIEWEGAIKPDDYCRKHCCIYDDSKYPFKMDSGCPILEELDKLKRFAMFPDE